MWLIHFFLDFSLIHVIMSFNLNKWRVCKIKNWHCVQILNLNEKYKSLEYHALICLNFKYFIILCYEHVIFHISNSIDINGIRWKVSNCNNFIKVYYMYYMHENCFCNLSYSIHCEFLWLFWYNVASLYLHSHLIFLFKQS